jgi:hypothetical protein
MTQDLFPHAWLTNNLFDEGFIEKKVKELSSKPLPHDFDNWMAGHFLPVQLWD